MMWNAVVRSTLTYGLTVNTLSKNDKEKIEKFTHRCIRSIDNEGVKYSESNPYLERNTRFRKCEQNSTETWVDYLNARHAINKNILETNAENENTRLKEGIRKWEAQWQKMATIIRKIKNDNAIFETQRQDILTKRTRLGTGGIGTPASIAKVLSTGSPKPGCNAPPNSTRVKLLNILGQKGLEELENQKWPKKNARTEFLLKQLIDYDSTEMTKIADRETLLKNTAIVLKYPEKKKTASEEYKCPTCKKGFYNQNSLNGHRSKDKICIIRWGGRKKKTP